MSDSFENDNVITRIVRNPFDFGPTYIKLTYGKEGNSYVLNEDSDNELKKYLKIFLVLATSLAEKKDTDDILSKNLYYLFDEKESLINKEEFSEFVKGLCSKVEETIKEKPAVITDAVEEGDSCPAIQNIKNMGDSELEKINKDCFENFDVKNALFIRCLKEPALDFCKSPAGIAIAAGAAGGGRKIKTQKRK